MATTTTHYGFTKPGVNDYVDISVLNANFDNLDTVIYNNQLSAQVALDDIAPAYDATATYSVGDYVTYNKTLYKCTTAITTAEAFDDTKWTAVKVGGELKSHDARISDLEAGVELEGEATNIFDDGIDSYFKKVESSIVAIQAGTGTPSPTNERPITGFTECTVKDASKNLLNNIATSQSITGVDFTVNSDKSVNVNTPSSSTATTQLILGEITLKANTSYKLSGCPSGGSGSSYTLYIQAASGFSQIVDYGNGVTFTPSVDVTTEVRIIIYNGAVVSNKVFYPMIRLATETDSTYAPYVAPTTATISFGSAGTVYGATVELISGKLVVYKAIRIFDGSEDWVEFSSGNYYLNNACNTDTFTSRLMPKFICNKYKEETVLVSSPSLGGQEDKTYFNQGGQWVSRIWIKDTSITSLTDFKNALSSTNLQVVYPLTTPQEYQLTPAQLRSLVGANRLTSSTGEVTEVEYIKNKTIAWLLDLIRA